MKIKTLKVTKIQNLYQQEDMYDITVEKNHNFFVKIGNNYLLSSNCHQLSNAAKNNLLKPIEEPPKHVLWCLCTTDPDKLPKATLTRCVKLYFTYPTLLECSKRLWKVCKKEYSKEVSEKIKPFIKHIASNSNCQMRDSYSVLERIAAIIIANPEIQQDTLKEQFNTILSTLGELTTPSIRFITHSMLNKYSLPLSIINELEPNRLSEFLNVLSRHTHYATMYFSLKKDNALKNLERKRFYGINFIRFDKALEEVYNKLTERGESPLQIIHKSVTLTSGILDAINKQRQGLLTAEQSVLCGINTFMNSVLKD